MNSNERSQSLEKFKPATPREQMSERTFQSIVAEHCTVGGGSVRSALKEQITILRFPQVKARVGKSRSSIYAAISEGTFPQPISLGPRSVGWLQEKIQSWLSARVEQSRSRVPSKVVNA